PSERAADTTQPSDDHAVKPRSDESVRIASDSVLAIGAEASPRTVVSIADVTKTFGHGNQSVVALEGVNLDVEQGEFVCLLGASGCGKSTLLNLVAGLDPTEAER